MSRMTYTPGASAHPQQQPSFRGSSSSQQQRGYHAAQQQRYGSAGYGDYTTSSRMGTQSQRSAPAAASAPKLKASAPETWVDTLIYTLDALPPPTTWPSHILDTLVLQPLAFVLAVITSPRTHRLILRLSLLTTVFWFALGLAIAAYIAFYNAWVPHLGLRVPVYLQYGDTAAAPWAQVYFDPPGRFFADDQQYDVTLELTVPLTPANLDLGNFMVSISMFADGTDTGASSQPIISSSRPTLLHPSPSTLNTLSSLISRNPNPDISPFGLASSGGALSSGPPITLLSVPLLRRAVLQVGGGSSFSVAATQPNKSSNKSSKQQNGGALENAENGRSPSANHLPGHVGVKHPSQNIVSARIVVGRSDSERYWMYGGGHGHGNGNGRGNGAGANEAFVSRGELQTHAVSLRFDAHLTGLRFFMYHYPLLSFLLFTSLFLACELGAAVFVAGIFALYSTVANSAIDVRTLDESFVVSAKSSKDADSPVVMREEVSIGAGGISVKREKDSGDEDGEADSQATSSSLLGTYDDEDDDEEGTTPGLEDLDDEDEDGINLSTATTAAERAYRSQMAARTRARMERAAGGGDYDDSDDTEREDETTARRPTQLGPQQQGGSGTTPPSSSSSATGPSGASAAAGGMMSSERRILGRLDEETEEETDQTSTSATTTTMGRRGTGADVGLGGGAPPSAGRPTPSVPAPEMVTTQPAIVGEGGSSQLGIGAEGDEDDEGADEEERAERTRARWEAWRVASERQRRGEAEAGTSPAAVARPSAGEPAEGQGEGENSPSAASWESVGADDAIEGPAAAEEREREAAQRAVSAAEARRLKQAEAEDSTDTAAEADDEDEGQAGPIGGSAVAGPSGTSSSQTQAQAAAAVRAADDELSTATEEEGEEGAKTAG